MTRVIHIDDLIHPVDKSPLFACQYLSLILLVTMLHPNIHSKDTHHFPFTLNSLIFNTIHIQWKEIYYPLRFGKTWWDSTEGVNIWSYQREKRKNHENCKTLFTLHQSIITIWYSEVLIGLRVSIHSSPLFTPSSPYYFFRFYSILLIDSGGWRESVFNIKKLKESTFLLILSYICTWISQAVAIDGIYCNSSLSAYM